MHGCPIPREGACHSSAGNTDDLLETQRVIGTLAPGASYELAGTPFTGSVAGELGKEATATGSFTDSTGRTLPVSATNPAYCLLTPAPGMRAPAPRLVVHAAPWFRAARTAGEAECHNGRELEGREPWAAPHLLRVVPQPSR